MWSLLSTSSFSLGPSECVLDCARQTRCTSLSSDQKRQLGEVARLEMQMQQDVDDGKSAALRQREAEHELQTLKKQVKDVEGRLAAQVPASKAKAEEARRLAEEQARFSRKGQWQTVGKMAPPISRSHLITPLRHRAIYPSQLARMPRAEA